MIRAALLTALVLTACGDETAILVDVDVSRFRVYEDLEALVFRVAAADSAPRELRRPLLEHQRHATLTLLPEQDDAHELSLTVEGFRGSNLVSSAGDTLRFEAGEQRTVEIVLPLP